MSQNVYSSIVWERERERERERSEQLKCKKNSSASMIITFHAQTTFVPIKETTKVDKVDPSW
jgi:hypothetical protein